MSAFGTVHADQAPASGRQAQLLQLSEALKAFDRGSAMLNTAPDQALAAFREARDKFQAVVSSGVASGALYYNLANTHLRLGEIGEAIAGYRRAERLMPANEELKANLRFARSLTHDQINPGGKRALLSTLFFWHYGWPLRTRLTVALYAYGLFWLLIVGRLFAPRLRLGYPALVSLAVWAPLAVSVGIELPSLGRPTEGVLVANDVVVRKGNGEGYDAQFTQPLHEGVEFSVLEDRGGWIHIELPDGHRGWVRQREVEMF